jgi:hypothetical protein
MGSLAEGEMSQRNPHPENWVQRAEKEAPLNFVGRYERDLLGKNDWLFF